MRTTVVLYQGMKVNVSPDFHDCEERASRRSVTAARKLHVRKSLDTRKSLAAGGTAGRKSVALAPAGRKSVAPAAPAGAAGRKSRLF